MSEERFGASPSDGGRTLLDVLACPKTKAPLVWLEGRLVAPGGQSYSVDEGVPILFPGDVPEVRHEGTLETWTEYEPGIALLLGSIPASEAILDLGSGNRDLDLPQIIRMDVCRTPHVDVVGDAHALPFRDETLGFVYATAVFEHLREPWIAAKEIWRVLKPGGYVLADCSFVFPFHGYPAMYFSASGEGLRQIFSDFTELEVAAAPWQMPSFAVEALLREYLRCFKPETKQETDFVRDAHALLDYPLREFDARFRPRDALRIAAAVSYLGIKQPEGTETLIPDPVMQLWREDERLRERFPKPEALLDLERGQLDNILHWTRTEGAAHPALESYFRHLVPFRKSSRCVGLRPAQ